MSIEDKELDEMFHGENKPLHQDAVYKTLEVGKTIPKGEMKAAKSDWMPPMPKPDFMDRLKASAKATLLYGGLSLLFFYFQQTGQMAMTASMPCICACIALAGFGVGRSFGGR